MPSIRHFPADQSNSAVFRAIKKDGACIVEKVFSKRKCNQLLADFQPFLDAMAWGENDADQPDEFYGMQSKRLRGLFSKSSRTAGIVVHPLLLATAEHFLLKDGRAEDIRISCAELMALNNRQEPQSFHTDGGSWAHAQSLEPGKEILINVIVALTDFRVENGATRVVPGSHLWPEFREPEQQEICHATMPAGSILLYSGNVVHSGGGNSTEQPRIGLYVGYLLSWLRPQENQMVTNDPKDILALPQKVKTLLDVVPGGLTVVA
jgi:hypothetical protein